MTVTIRDHPERDGLQLVDSIEGVHYDFYLPPEADLTEGEPDSDIPVPVDEIESLQTPAVTFPKQAELIVLTSDMESLGTIDPGTPEVPQGVTRGAGPYLLDVLSTPLKLYLRLPGGFNVSVQNGDITLSFSSPQPITVAARSFHSEPAGTITAGPGVECEMRALSHLGSALQTTSPERSWPTLRGHPPLVEPGDTETIPDHIEPPDVDVRLEVPRDREYVYLAAPLVYYLGATIEPTSGPPCLTAADRTVDLNDAYQTQVNTLLRRMVFLDTIARREGLYPFELEQHRDALSLLDEDVDWSHLYDLPIGERVAAYLDDRFRPIVDSDALPSWHVTTDIQPDRRALGTIPFVAGDLSLCRLAESASTPPTRETPDAISHFTRAGSPKRKRDSSSNRLNPLEVSRVSAPSTPEHQWIGDQPVWDAHLLDQSSLEKHLSHSPEEKEDYVTSVTLVCNDPEMSDEFVDQVYGIRDLLEYDIVTFNQLTCDELRDVLHESRDLLHYVGHVDSRGLQCADGWLDVRTFESVDINAFVLNACQSYHQGQALLDAGAFAGVVTLENVSNTLATRIGQQLARLLDTGLRFRSALSIIREYIPASYRYIVLGAGDYQMVHSDTGCPLAASVERRTESQEFRLELSYYPCDSYDAGSIVSPVLDGDDKHYLGMGEIGPWIVGPETLREFCQREPLPVDFEGELVWSQNIAMALTEKSDYELEDLWGQSS